MILLVLPRLADIYFALVRQLPFSDHLRKKQHKKQTTNKLIKQSAFMIALCLASLIQIAFCVGYSGPSESKIS
jgi:hypothetical protein